MGKTEENSDKKGNGACFFQELDIEFLIHEMKDPLAIIETGVRTLMERQDKYGALTKRQDKTLKRILRNTRKARGMIYSLLEIGRSESGGFTLCEFYPAEATYEALVDALEAMVGEVPESQNRFDTSPAVDKFLSDQHIFLDFSPDAVACQLYQDRVKFCQIAGNLIKNALHHRKARLDIRLHCQSNSIVVEVADDGPGIDATHHRQVFQRYRQLNAAPSLTRKGHGLGLAGARALARFMGGDVQLDSRQGHGATFKLILPVKMKVPASPAPE